MASSRSGPRRGNTPAVLAPQPKPVISVEDWEAKAPLGELQLRSVAVLKEASEKQPLPLKFTQNDTDISRPSTPRNRLIPQGTGSRPSTPSLAGSSIRQGGQAQHALHPKHPIQTPQQFYDWFALVERSVTHSQEAHFRAHIASVSGHLGACDELIERIDEIDSQVDSMLDGWRGVEEGGKSLKDACERLLEERDRLLELTEDIGSRLDYFQELEHATRMLNHPGESLVLQTDFLYMVERVDICIDFLKAHRHFKEAEVYLLRFQQCMTRAMTLIKMFFVGSLRALSADISKRLNDKAISSTAQTHLLYTRFRSTSAQLAPLLGQLERRARAHPEELSSLLAECHSAYFSTRKSLVIGRVIEEIKGLDPAHTELVELTRAGCSYLKQLCTDEFDLFREFFSTGEEELYAYLENLCDYLYDDLRPRILHEPRLTALCEVCTVLQALMVLDVAEPRDTASQSSSLLFSAPGGEDGPSSSKSVTSGQADREETSNDEDDELTLDLEQLDGGRRKGHGLGRLRIAHLLQMVLQDAQTRLFFKAQSVIQAEIRYYVPKPEDLAYPDKLVAARKPSSRLEIKEKESFSEMFRLPSLDKQETWYPTLQKTVWVLSQLHEFVKPAIFEDIAQEAVSLCRQSLLSAAELIRARTSPMSALDSSLFLVRHLLILKEVTNTLDLAQRDIEDLGGVAEAFTLMLSKTTSLLPNALFASLGMPKADENLSEAKHSLDTDLRIACEAVIGQCADPICEPLRQWVSQLQDFAASTRQTSSTSRSSSQRKGSSAPAPSTDAPSGAPPSLSAQPWAQKPALETISSDFRAACAGELRSRILRLRLFLEDGRTAGVLASHVRARVLEAHGTWRDAVWGVLSGEPRNAVMTVSEAREIVEEACREGEGSADTGGESR